MGEVEHRRANRQYKSIPEGEVWKYIDSREKLIVAFPMEDGYPHVTPVWFCMLNKKLYFRAQDYKVKARLAKAGKVCCLVEDGRKYVELRGVTIWGRSRTVSEKELVAKLDTLMAAKYREHQWKPFQMPAEWIKERTGERRIYVEITPIKMSSWDNSRVSIDGTGMARRE